MKALGIETSCDETSVAIVESRGDKHKVLSNIVSSQVKIHAPYGGVVPSLAAREHQKNLIPVFEKALRKAPTPKSRGSDRSVGAKMAKIDLIAVTVGPGLEIALWKGVNFAKALALIWKKPLIGVNHLEGHIYSNWLDLTNGKKRMANNKIFPALNLIASGGHTQLVLMAGHGEFKTVGETLDDAAGEAFDKVAKMLNLGYPGGPIISKVAEKGNPKKYNLPRPMLNQKNYNFSFAGLKTAVLYLLKEQKAMNYKLKTDIAASFQQAAIDVLVLKTIRAAKEFKVKSIFLSGGVSANKLLRKTLEKEVKKIKVFYSQPDFEYTGDNAAMIAVAGYFKNLKAKNKKVKGLKAEPNLKIKNWN